MPGLYSITTRADGTTLTAAIYNADHQNHVDNHIPSMMDDISSDAAAMQTTTDPGESGSESLATSLDGELKRLRFAIKDAKGTTYWYETPSTTLESLAAKLSGHSTPVDLTNGGANDQTAVPIYESIPAGVKQIKVILNFISLSASNGFVLELGSTTYATTGYLSVATLLEASASTGNINDGALIAYTPQAGRFYTGVVVFTRIQDSAHDWAWTGAIGESAGGPSQHICSGGVTLAGELDRIQITSEAKTGTFDSGEASMQWFF